MAAERTCSMRSASSVSPLAKRCWLTTTCSSFILSTPSWAWQTGCLSEGAAHAVSGLFLTCALCLSLSPLTVRCLTSRFTLQNYTESITRQERRDSRVPARAWWEKSKPAVAPLIGRQLHSHGPAWSENGHWFKPQKSHSRHRPIQGSAESSHSPAICRACALVSVRDARDDKTRHIACSIAHS